MNREYDWESEIIKILLVVLLFMGYVLIRPVYLHIGYTLESADFVRALYSSFLMIAAAIFMFFSKPGILDTEESIVYGKFGAIILLIFGIMSLIEVLS